MLQDTAENNDILADRAELFLGSRLKRLAERMQAGAARAMRDAGLPVQPAQFPLLAAVHAYGPLSVSRAVEIMGISQPVVTRTLGTLVDQGFLETVRDAGDQRLKTIRLTPCGQGLMAQATQGLWPRVEAAVREICAGLDGPLLDQITALEAAMEESPLDARIAASREGLRIRAFDDALAPDFYRINAQWVEAMFTLEENDIQLLSHPRERIVDAGGEILFVESDDLGVIGTCALIRMDEGVYELTKMGVSENARGRKAGEFLLAAMLDKARAMQVDTLYLLTSSKCEAAIHLYEKLGFVHSQEIMTRYGARYARCNVAMLYEG